LVAWYTRHGFQPTRSDGLRLYMRIATARKYPLLVGVLGELTD